jgi:hypothetical protein
LAGVVGDLADIERGGLAGEGKVAMQRPAFVHPFDLVRRCCHGIAECRRKLLEFLAVEPMHGHVDAKPLFGAIDEFLAKRRPDVGGG